MPLYKISFLLLLHKLYLLAALLRSFIFFSINMNIFPYVLQFKFDFCSVITNLHAMVCSVGVGNFMHSQMALFPPLYHAYTFTVLGHCQLVN